MRLIKLMAIAVVLGAVAITAASASAASTKNPQYAHTPPKGVLTLYANGAKEVITAKANGAQTLSGGGITIICLKLHVGATDNVKGVAANAQGTSAETITYEECSAGASFPNCKVKSSGQPAGTIVTLPLENKLYWRTAVIAAAGKGESVTGFFPVTPKKFVTIELEELKPKTGECPVQETTAGVPAQVAVEGSVACVNVASAKEEGKEINELECLEAPIKEAFANNAKSEAIATKFALTAFGFPAAYFGKSQITLKSNELWGVMAG